MEKTRINKNEGKEIALTFKNGIGFDSFDATINAAFGLEIFERSGPIYTSSKFPEQKWKGREALVQYFKDNTKEYELLVEACNQASLEASLNNVTSDNIEQSEE